MKHKHHWLQIWFHDNCPACWLRRFRYGYRLDPIGYMEDRNKIWDKQNLTPRERLQILDLVHPIEIDNE